MARRISQSKPEMGSPSKEVITFAVLAVLMAIAVRKYQQSASQKSGSQDPLHFLSV